MWGERKGEGEKAMKCRWVINKDAILVSFGTSEPVYQKCN